jgi:hypothetical protein
MKKQIVFTASAGIILLFAQSFRSVSVRQKEIPAEVSTILKTSCYDCHFTGARAQKALDKINFDDWDTYRPVKKIGLLGDIGKMVEEEKMPPEKFLENNPGAQLTEVQKKLLIGWTKQESANLMQGD